MIIVTGAAGFIGSNLLAELQKKTDKPIVACDYLDDNEKWQNLAKRDIYDFVAPESLFDFLDEHKGKIEIIFHMGAISSTDATDGDLVMDTNYRLSMDLFDWCGINNARFIYASSAATYGDGAHGFIDSEAPEYLEKLRPLNLYGWSKHIFDKSVQQRLDRKKTPLPPQWAGLKFFNVYGPNEHHKGSQSSVIPHFLQQILNHNCASLFESYKDGVQHGDQARDFVSVHDAVDVMLWLMDTPNVSGLFNVAFGKAHTFIDVADGIFKAINRDRKVDFIPMPEKLIKHYQYFTEGPIEKLRAAGYQTPMTPLDKGIHDYIHDYLLNDDPYR